MYFSAVRGCAQWPRSVYPGVLRCSLSVQPHFAGRMCNAHVLWNCRMSQTWLQHDCCIFLSVFKTVRLDIKMRSLSLLIDSDSSLLLCKFSFWAAIHNDYSLELYHYWIILCFHFAKMSFVFKAFFQFMCNLSYFEIDNDGVIQDIWYLWQYSSVVL